MPISEDVDMDELVLQTDTYSGAEVRGSSQNIWVGGKWRLGVISKKMFDANCFKYLYIKES